MLGTLVLVVAFALASGAGMYPFLWASRPRILTEVLVAILLLAWGVFAIARADLRPRTVLAGPASVAMLAFGASVAFSQRPRLSLEPALLGVTSALTFLALAAILRRPSARRLLATAFILVSGFVAVAYVVQVGVAWLRYWSLIGRLAMPPLRPAFVDLSTGSPNLVATLLLLLTPLAVVVAWRRGSWIASALLAIVALVALVLTGSRGAYIGGAAGAVVVLGAAVVELREHATEVRRRLRATGPAWVVIVVGVGVGAVLAAVLAFQRLTLSGADLRITYWRSAIDLFRSSPIVGTGPGTWPQLKIADLGPTDVNYVVPHAHSLLFQTLPEVGALGLAGLVVFGIAVAARAAQLYRTADRWDRLEITICGASIVAVLGQQAFDYLFNLPAITLLVGILIAWIDGTPVDTGKAAAAGQNGFGTRWTPIVGASLRLGTPLAVTLAVILVASVPTVTRIDQAMIYADTGTAAADLGNWQAALDSYGQAGQLDPDLALYHIEQAAALAHLARLDEAQAQYQAAIGQDLLSENVLSLAAIDLQLGDTAAAIDLADVGLQRGWLDANAAVNAGRIFEAAGRLDLAQSAYASAVRDDPPLIHAGYWSDPARRVDKNAVADQARALARKGDDPATGALILAFAGRVAEARLDTQDIANPGDRDLLRAIIEGISGDRPQGISALRARFTRDPSDFLAAAWLSRILSLDANPEATMWFEIATLLRGDEAPVGATLLDQLPSAATDRDLGAWTSYPFAVYARGGPTDLWAPQFLVIGSSFRG
jgi:O-antigen ligase/tetratricopeptide (TPR) repeat protein